jgi:2-oxo-4-hydroxy-4-carboxy-5-ureidoimidazoline decarboxylase
MSLEHVDKRLAWLNGLNASAACSELQRCCGSLRWAEQLAARRPFDSMDELLRQADDVWWHLSSAEWKEAFAHHPKIGDIGSLRKKFSATAHWAADEQAGATNVSDEVLKALSDGNKQYEEKFGYIFIVCATGKSAEEMLEILNERLPNSPEKEITIAAAEQAKITRLRLEKLLNASNASNSEP